MQPSTQSLLDKKNIDEIRKQARSSVESGAVTNDYPLDITEACILLNSALSTEILCVLRYRHHQVIAKGINYLQISEEFREHAEEEEQHMMMLAERINQLGGDPDFSPKTVIDRSLTEYGSSTTLRDMIKDDLIAERAVISYYRKLIEWFQADSTTRTMLEHILKDEEDHADELADLLVSTNLQAFWTEPTLQASTILEKYLMGRAKILGLQRFKKLTPQKKMLLAHLSSMMRMVSPLEGKFLAIALRTLPNEIFDTLGQAYFDCHDELKPAPTYVPAFLQNAKDKLNILFKDELII